MSTIATMPNIADDETRSVAASDHSIEPAVQEKLTRTAYKHMMLLTDVRYWREKLDSQLAYAKNFEEDSKQYPSGLINQFKIKFERAKQAEQEFVDEQEAKKEAKQAKKRARDDERRTEKELLDVLRPEERALISQDTKRVMRAAADSIKMLLGGNPTLTPEERLAAINANRAAAMSKPLELPPPKKAKTEAAVDLDSDDDDETLTERALKLPTAAEATPPPLARMPTVAAVPAAA